MRSSLLALPIALLSGCVGAGPDLSESGTDTHAGWMATHETASAPKPAGEPGATRAPAPASAPEAQPAPSASATPSAPTPAGSNNASPVPSATPDSTTASPRMRELASTPSAQPFALTGLFWNGNAEQVDSIDDVSGASAVLGTLGDFQYWSLECLESSERTHVFSVGHGADDGIELYDFELANAGLRTLALAEEYALAGTLADGRLLAVYTNGNVRQVDALDPQTGQAQKLGDFGDLMVGNFFGWLAFDAKRGLLYALGTDAIDSNQNKLYAFDLAKGVTRSVPVDELPWAVGGVRRDGTLLAIRWTGDAEIAAAIDPDSGAVHELGQLGDLQLWMGRPLYVEANDSLYTPGFDANNTRFLYRLDLATGTSSQVPLGANYTLVKR